MVSNQCFPHPPLPTEPQIPTPLIITILTVAAAVTLVIATLCQTQGNN